MPESYSLGGLYPWRSGQSQKPVVGEQKRIALICRHGFADRNRGDAASRNALPLRYDF